MHGINFFDLCVGGESVYKPFGRAIAGQREKVFFQLHFGAVYNDKGEYGWSRDLNEIQETFAWELKTLGTDYADFGFLHCVDEDTPSVAERAKLFRRCEMESVGISVMKPFHGCQPLRETYRKSRGLYRLRSLRWEMSFPYGAEQEDERNR